MYILIAVMNLNLTFTKSKFLLTLPLDHSLIEASDILESRTRSLSLSLSLSRVQDVFGLIFVY